MANSSWYRLSLDLDRAGNVLGSSYEVHVGERVVAIHTLPAPDPFVDMVQAFVDLLDDVVSRYGIQITLY